MIKFGILSSNEKSFLYDAMYKKYKDAIRCSILKDSFICYNTRNVVVEKFGFKRLKKNYARSYHYHNNGMLFCVDDFNGDTRIRATHSNFSEFYFLVKFLKAKFNIGDTLELCSSIIFNSNEQEIFDALNELGYKRESGSMCFKSCNGLRLMYHSQHQHLVVV